MDGVLKEMKAKLVQDGEGNVVGWCEWRFIQFCVDHGLLVKVRRCCSRMLMNLAVRGAGET